MATTARGERSGTETRRRIVGAARVAFARRGIHATTLEEIAREAGVSRPGLLHHFGSKHQLLAAVFERQSHDQLQAWLPPGVSLPDDLNEIDPDSPSYPDIDFAAALQIAEKVAQANADGPDNVRLTHLSALDPAGSETLAADWARTRHQRVRKLVAASVRRSISNGTIRPDVNPDDIGTMVVTAFEGLETQWLVDPDFDMAAHFKNFTALLSRALSR